jgi:hypothetical protein
LDACQKRQQQGDFTRKPHGYGLVSGVTRRRTIHSGGEERAGRNRLSRGLLVGPKPFPRDRWEKLAPFSSRRFHLGHFSLVENDPGGNVHVVLRILDTGRAEPRVQILGLDCADGEVVSHFEVETTADGEPEGSLSAYEDDSTRVHNIGAADPAKKGLHEWRDALVAETNARAEEVLKAMAACVDMGTAAIGEAAGGGAAERGDETQPFVGIKSHSGGSAIGTGSITIGIVRAGVGVADEKVSTRKILSGRRQGHRKQ